MKYDDIILQCLGDCDTCSVYLECQYQTSFGEEKDKYLKLLTERDETAEKEKQSGAEALAEENADSAEDVSPAEEPATEKCDCEAEVCAEKTSEELIASPVTAALDEEVKAIYEEVFNLNDAATVSSPEVAEEVASETVSVAEENGCDKEAENRVEVTPAVVDDKAVTPISEEEVKAIYEEVFNLKTVVCEEKTNENTACVAVAKEPVEAATEDANETIAEAVCEKPSCVTPASDDTVKAIYAEVFGLDLTVPVACEKEAEEVKQPAAACTEDVKENIEKVEEVKEAVEVPEPEKAAPAPVKETFKLTPPENNEQLMADMCAKRGRKLIYKPSEALITASFKVIGTDKKNDIGEKVKDILDAEIKQGVKVGYLDKFDGLNSSEIKEEYENDIVYEFADQEFKKTGVIYDGKKIKVYIYDWDGKACHHVGYVDTSDAAELIPYFVDKDKYSFDVCGIITGGKGKRVVKEGNTLKIVKEKGDPIGVDVDIAVLNRKD